MNSLLFYNKLKYINKILINKIFYIEEKLANLLNPYC